MAVIKVPTSFNIDVEFEIPEFYRRLMALLIDFLILIIYSKIASQVLRSIASSTYDSSDDFWFNIQAVAMLIIMVPILIYHLVLEITMNGQSVGKRIMKMKVVHENGGKAGLSQFLIRWLLRDIWFLFLFLLVFRDPGSGESIFIMIIVFIYFITEIVMVVATKKGQRIGDLLAHTILIRISSKSNIEETVFQEVAAGYIPSFPQIMQLSDKDINAIKNILEAARKKGDYDMAAKASEKIKAHLKIESSMSPFDFLDVLLKDYNYLSVK